MRIIISQKKIENRERKGQKGERGYACGELESGACTVGLEVSAENAGGSDNGGVDPAPVVLDVFGDGGDLELEVDADVVRLREGDLPRDVRNLLMKI